MYVKMNACVLSFLLFLCFWKISRNHLAG